MINSPRVCAFLALAAFDETVRHAKAMPEFAVEFLSAGGWLMGRAEQGDVDEETCELVRGAYRRALAALGVPERPVATPDVGSEGE